MRETLQEEPKTLEDYRNLLAAKEWQNEQLWNEILYFQSQYPEHYQPRVRYRTPFWKQVIARVLVRLMRLGR